MSEPVPDFTAIPLGRMITILKIETALRMGDSYPVAAKRMRVSDSSAKTWARLVGIRKCDLGAETPECRAERYASWALRLVELGRHDEAGAYEAEARKLEMLLGRLGKRLEASGDAPDEMAPAKALLARVQESLPAGADVCAAWTAIADYYAKLRGLGAEVAEDGRVSWKVRTRTERVPACPAWLPCEPWGVEDDDLWSAGVGDGLRLL
jgi:hypothetical protein